MGNYFNRGNPEVIDEPEQLIEDNNNEQNNNILATGIKTIIKVKNPFYLLKETIHLEKDSNKNIYYIKFNYDSLINFSCFINFNVKKNSQRNNLKQKDEYELCYFPTDSFVEKNIVINNLSQGKNQEFYNENAFLDYDYFEQNTTRRKEELEEYEEEEEEEDDIDNNDNINENINDHNNNQVNEETSNNRKQNEENESLININNNENIENSDNKDNENNNNNENEEYEEIFDIGIEFFPYYDKNSEEFEQNMENNEIALISLFNIEKKENNELEIKCVSQQLKKHNYFFELKDIYDDTRNNGKCIICYTNNRNTIFLPCRHSCCCLNCSGTLKPKICPLCKNIIQDIICLNKNLDNEISNEMNETEEESKNNSDNEVVQSINES